MVKNIKHEILVRISRTILFIMAFVLIFGFFSAQIKDPDFFWHLKTGQYIYQTGSLPATDPFAYTSLPKDPLNPESKRIKFILKQYWLAQVIFYKVYDLAGFQGIIYLRASILALLILLIYKGMRREGGGFYLSLLLLVPVVIMLHAFTGERPQLFSFLFAFLLIYLIEGFRKTETNGDSSRLAEAENTPLAPPLAKGRLGGVSLNKSPRVSGFLYLLPLPLIMLLWANLHGGFIAGIVVILGYLFAESLKYISKRGRSLSLKQLKLLSITGFISLIMPFINPNGFNVLSVLLEFERSPYKHMIIESMSPLFLLRSGFHEAYLLIYFLLLSLSVLIFLVNIKKLDFTDVVITAGLAFMSLSSARYIPFFSPVAVLMIARYGSGVLSKFPRIGILKAAGKRVDILFPVILTIALIIVINNTDLFKSGIKANNYPEGAVRFLKENRIQGNMFNPYVWGGYLMWSLYPDYKVFIDGRGLIGDVFFEEVKVMEAYSGNLAGLPEWKAYLNAYDVNFIITYSVGNFTGRLVPLIPALLHDPEWHLVYFDNISLIFVRENARNSEILKRFDLPKEWLWNEVAVEAGLKAQDYRGNANYLITEGDALLAKQSYSDAKTAYLRALQIDPRNALVEKRLEIIRAYGY